MVLRAQSFTRLVLLFSLPSIAARCGGGGGSSNAVASTTVSSEFPDAVALTDAADLVLHGTAHDSAAITSLSVNGQGVVSFDAFAHWSIDFALPRGDSRMSFDAIDARGRRSVGSLGTIRRVPLAMHSPQDVVVVGSEAFVLDGSLRALVDLDLKAGSATILSDPFLGSGAPFSFAAALDVDTARSLAWVVDDNQSVVEVDLKTGDRTPFSGASRGTGPLPNDANSVVDDATGKRVLIVDRFGAAILAADETTGDRVVFSDASHGVGTNFQQPLDAVLDSANSRLLVADGSLLAIFSVSLKNGARKILSDASNGTGPNFNFPQAVALSSDGTRLFVLDHGDGTIVSVDLVTGNRALVSDGAKAGPPILDGTRNIAFTTVGGDHVLIADDRAPELVSVLVKSGGRGLIQPWRIGSGSALENPIGVEVDPAARRLVVADIDSVKTIDLATGVRTEFSQPAGGSGPALQQTFGVARDPAHHRIFVSDSFEGILTIDTQTGNRELLVDPVALISLQSLSFGLAFDPAAGLLYFDGTSAQNEMEVFTVDVASRGILAISDSIHGAGPAFGFLTSLSLTADHKTLLAVDTGNTAVFLVDTATGNRTVVASSTDGRAPAVSLISAGAIAPDGSFALVTGESPQGTLTDECLFSIALNNGNQRGIVSSNLGGLKQGPFWNVGNGVAIDPVKFVAYVTEDDAVAVFAVDLETGTRVVVGR